MKLPWIYLCLFFIVLHKRPITIIFPFILCQTIYFDNNIITVDENVSCINSDSKNRHREGGEFIKLNSIVALLDHETDRFACQNMPFSG